MDDCQFLGHDVSEIANLLLDIGGNPHEVVMRNADGGLDGVKAGKHQLFKRSNLAPQSLARELSGVLSGAW
jgi:hypothetical protein